MASWERFGRWPIAAKRARIDADGELYAPPAALTYVWAVMILLVILEAVNEIFRVGGPSSLYVTWFHEGVIAVAGLLVLARSFYEPTASKAWRMFGLAMVSWSIGSIGWILAYNDAAHPPSPSFADAFWLLWYPMVVLGVKRLIQVRFKRFAWEQWMDGVAVVLVILTAGVAIVAEPSVAADAQSVIGDIVDFAYPILDVLLVGTFLGVYSLLAWRPDRMWVLLGSGFVMISVADAVSAVQEAHGIENDESFAFVWTLGALCIAYAAWVRSPAGAQDNPEVTGLRAVALPLLAQALAAGVQIYAFFVEIGRSERIVTIVVLVVASVQIVITRPRPKPTGDGSPDAASPAGEAQQEGVEDSTSAPAPTS